ncbi:MAG: 23S rRNA (pseudouridine(1915)-N(3))-methyltransferase RlmH [Hyphomicrobiaceae bacterium]|nr:23S rRNA (pseudouridine(1915)-N(3))-methyltransferase RlmH [Hyphomicrobiaceae bacterium]
MDITILAVGRLKGPEQELCERYVSRVKAMGRSLGIGDCRLVVLNEGRGGSLKARQSAEALALLQKAPDKSVLVALDEHGKDMTSQSFSKRITRFRDESVGQLVFVLGGPDGHGPELLQRAALKLSLSPMTMPHGLARAVCCEQIYRALTILANHPYHRE